MKNLYKNLNLRYLISIILLVCGLAASGQDRPGQERIEAERVAYFTEELQLSPAEAQKFWPVYNDYNNRKELLNDESRMLLRFVNNNLSNMNKEEVALQLEKYMDIQDRMHQLSTDYHQKFLEVLPPAKVMKLYITETRFKQYLLRRISDARKQRQGGRRF